MILFIIILLLSFPRSSFSPISGLVSMIHLIATANNPNFTLRAAFSSDRPDAFFNDLPPSLHNPVPLELRFPDGYSAHGFLHVGFLIFVVLVLGVIATMNWTRTRPVCRQCADAFVTAVLSDVENGSALDVIHEEVSMGLVSNSTLNSAAANNCVGMVETDGSLQSAPSTSYPSVIDIMTSPSYAHAPNRHNSLIRHPKMFSTNSADNVAPTFTSIIPVYVEETRRICSKLDRLAELVRRGVSPTYGDLKKQINAVVSRASNVCTLVMKNEDEDVKLIKEPLCLALIEVHEAALRLVQNDVHLFQPPSFRSQPIVVGIHGITYGPTLSRYMKQVEELVLELGDVAWIFREAKSSSCRDVKTQIVRLIKRAQVCRTAIKYESDKEVVLLKEFMCSTLDEVEVLAKEAYVRQ